MAALGGRKLIGLWQFWLKGSLLQQSYLKNAPLEGRGIFQVAFCESVVLTPNTGSSHLQGIDIHRPSGRGKLPCQRGEGLLP